jgi:plasmid stability protein
MPRLRTPIKHGTPTQTLYVRRLPQTLSDRIRIEAARRHTTMEWVAIMAVKNGLPLLEADTWPKEKKHASL